MKSRHNTVRPRVWQNALVISGFFPIHFSFTWLINTVRYTGVFVVYSVEVRLNEVSLHSGDDLFLSAIVFYVKKVKMFQVVLAVHSCCSACRNITQKEDQASI